MLNKSLKSRLFLKTACKYFPRTKKEPENKGNILKKVDKHSKLEEEVKESHKDRKMEFRSKRNEVFMAWDFDKVREVPTSLEKMAVKVFSKYSVHDIREWKRKYLLQYAQMHAVEPPINLVKFKTDTAFANTEEMDIKAKYFKSMKDKEEAEFPDKVIDIGEEKFKKDKESRSKVQINYEVPHAVAYLYARMPFTFYVGSRILEEISGRMPAFKPVNMLDFGAGLGSQIWFYFN